MKSLTKLVLCGLIFAGLGTVPAQANTPVETITKQVSATGATTATRFAEKALPSFFDRLQSMGQNSFKGIKYIGHAIKDASEAFIYCPAHWCTLVSLGIALPQWYLYLFANEKIEKDKYLYTIPWGSTAAAIAFAYITCGFHLIPASSKFTINK